MAAVASSTPTAVVVPVVERFIDDCDTPVSAFLKLRAAPRIGAGPCFLLESAEQGRVGRYSFLGFHPHAVLRWNDGRLREWRGEGARDLNADPSAEHEAPDPYAAIAAYLERHRFEPDGELPPFAGGAVGFFAYDLVRTVEPLGPPNPDPLGLPDMALMVSEVMLAFDHLKHELAVIAYAFSDGETDPGAARARAEQAIGEVREALRQPVPSLGHPAGDPASADAGAQEESPSRRRGQGVRAGAEQPAGSGFQAGAEQPAGRGFQAGAEAVAGSGFQANMTRERFEANVSRIIEYIHAGDAFQVVPSQRFSAPATAEAFSIYRGLRAINPSPYMYFLEFGDFQLAGASPEPLVKVSGRRVETRPIAGTYPRGGSEDEDRRQAEALLADPKERAEHVMLVDLGRNDLGRVCEYGSVTVDELMVVETYSHVLHIVSQVSGTLRDDVTAIDALRAVLPAGTLSGAPKVRAMQIIDELEPHKRGSYGGAIGYLGFGGDLDTAIHIRTVVVKDGIVHVQAGGGTVADAKPDYEYRESLSKAEAVFRAVELAAGEPGWP
jgi:anthranilate synthase component I